MTDQPEKLDLRSHTLPADKTAELFRLFPEILTEADRIDFDRLKLVLGETVDIGKERYGLTWPGKADCFKIIQAPTEATLLPCPEESVNFDVTENIIIEGDNLEVLKLLQKAYQSRIKMIYIDPPYNTGNDFIYPDNYTESLQTYLEYTGQVDSEGKKFSTNTDTEGRFHTRWLNMMYPRLFLARNLLRDDGVIFISIDDNEVANLRRICDEIFGELSFIAMFTWQSKKGGGSDTEFVVTDHEYVLCYGKTKNTSILTKIQLVSEPLDRSDENGLYRRGRELNKWGSGARRVDRPTMWFPIPGPNGEDVYPIRNDGTEGRWRLGKKNMMKMVNDGDVEFVMRDNGTYIAYEKIRSSDPRLKPYRTWLTDVGATADGSKTVRDLFGGTKVYDFPKPVDLLKKLITIGTSGDGEIVLDFFAGSGTIAHAVFELNNDSDGDVVRSFVCIQLPEKTKEDTEAFKAGFRTIAEICKERVRRVIRKISPEESEDMQFQGLGARVFKLAQSSFRTWNAALPADADALQQQLDLHIDHLLPGRTSLDLLTEILLKSGFPLTAPVETLTLAGKTVYRVAGGALLVCLDRELDLELIRLLAAQAPERVVLLDAGFNGQDALKTNAVHIFKDAGVSSFKTV